MAYSIIPADYSTLNVCDSAVSPSTIHASNNALTFFFRKYFLQQAFSVFEFSGYPKTWKHGIALFKYVLFGCGFVAVINTDRFGIIPLNCSPYGRGVFYQPTEVIITNPLLQGLRRLRIDIDCSVIRLQPDWSGIMDLISYYADLSALTCESFGVNLINTKLAYAFFSENRQEAESFKKMYDQIQAGNPAVFPDKKLIRDDGQPSWMMFNQDVKQTYIGLELLETLANIENRFHTKIGIPNANTDKKERMIKDEVNANNVETKALAQQWLEQMQQDIQDTNELFGTSLAVRLAKDPAQDNSKEDADNAGNDQY